METKIEPKPEALAETKPESRLAPPSKAPLEFMPSNVDDAWRMAQWFAQALIVPDALRGKPYDMLIVILMGAEFGFSPMVAMREIYVVKGKPHMSALSKVGLVKRSPLCEWFRCVESTAEKAVFETSRRGEGKTRMEFTAAEARKAGLLGRVTKSGEPDNWEKYQALMLRRRCSSQLADEVYSDVTRGIGLLDDIPEEQPQSRLGNASAPPTPQMLKPTSVTVNKAPVSEDTEGLGDIPTEKAKPVESPGIPPAPVEREPGSDDGAEDPAPTTQTSANQAPDVADVLLAELQAATLGSEIDALAVRAKAYQGPRRAELSTRFAARRKELASATSQP